MSAADWKAGAPPYASCADDVAYRLQVTRRAQTIAERRDQDDKAALLARRYDDLLGQWVEMVRQEVAS